MDLNRKKKAIIVIGVILFAFLLWYRATSNRSEIADACSEFTELNGCYLNQSELDELDVYHRLENLVEDSRYPSVEAACGCIEHDIIPDF